MRPFSSNADGIPVLKLIFDKHLSNAHLNKVHAFCTFTVIQQLMNKIHAIYFYYICTYYTKSFAHNISWVFTKIWNVTLTLAYILLLMYDTVKLLPCIRYHFGHPFLSSSNQKRFRKNLWSTALGWYLLKFLFLEINYS